MAEPPAPPWPAQGGTAPGPRQQTAGRGEARAQRARPPHGGDSPWRWPQLCLCRQVRSPEPRSLPDSVWPVTQTPSSDPALSEDSTGFWEKRQPGAGCARAPGVLRKPQGLAWSRKALSPTPVHLCALQPALGTPRGKAEVKAGPGLPALPLPQLVEEAPGVRYPLYTRAFGGKGTLVLP